MVSHLPAITVAGNTGYQQAEWKSCSQGYPLNAALLQSSFSQCKMEESNFLDFCKHGRKQTCYTEAAEVLRWQTRAACQKRRRSCQTNCNKTKINLKMENADTVSSKPSAEKSLSHFQGEQCYTMPPRSLIITLSSLTSSTAITTSSLNGLLQSSKNLILPLEKGKGFGFFKP